jgi:hypothetical protein
VKTASLGVVILLVLPMGIAAAQQQEQQPTSAADAAHKTRDQKKTQPKAAKVWDNDNIPKTPENASAVGPAAPASGNPAGDNSAAAVDSAANPPADAAAAASSGEESAQDDAATQSQISAAKQRLATLKTDLDILKRTNVLDEKMYYGKPDYASDTAGAAKLKDEESAISAKQAEVDGEQKKIDELEAKLKTAPAPASDNNTGTHPN